MTNLENITNTFSTQWAMTEQDNHYKTVEELLIHSNWFWDVSFDEHPDQKKKIV